MPVKTKDIVDRLFELAVVLHDAMDRRLADDGLTPVRAEVIWLLHRYGPLTQRELSDMLDCTPRNVTGLVDVLETAGFVLRAPHPTDRRARLITLTARGVELSDAWGTDRNREFAQVFAGLPDAELATFDKVLEHVLTNLRPDLLPSAAPPNGPTRP
jgi:DNA-binding MarR family transcriptional regulator